MLSALLLCTLRQESMPVNMNGVYLSDGGAIITVAAPYTIWGNFHSRSYAAFGMHSVDNGGWYGNFETNENLVVGWPEDQERASDPQLIAQKDLLTFYQVSYGTPPVGDILPYVPVSSSTHERGDIKIHLGPTGLLNISWIDQQGTMISQEPLHFIGKSDYVSVSTTYAEKDCELSIQEDPGRGRRTFNGSIQIAGATYTIHGQRVWGRGAFNMVNRDTGSIAGVGWLEWRPTPEFLEKMKMDGPAPSDRIALWLKPKSGLYSWGGTARFLKAKSYNAPYFSGVWFAKYRITSI